MVRAKKYEVLGKKPRARSWVVISRVNSLLDPRVT